MKFLDRYREQKRLNKALQKPEGQLLVIYGRRRCGKSTLIKNTLSSHDIYFMAQQTDETLQRQQLASVIAEKFPGFSTVVYPTWESIFMSLANYTRGPVTLCLDEFPYLVKSSPELPSVLQKIIDQQQNKKYHILICGSSQQMMNSLALDSSSPLYGRASEILKIKPLEAGWITEALECDAIQSIKEYAVWGGIPRYWELRKSENNFEEGIKNLILDNQGVLHEEPSRLFLDDMRESVQAYSILAIVGNGANRVSEIASRLNKPASQLSRPIEKLISLGYLKRELPFGENVKNSKKGIYRISEPFFNFYFTFVVPHLSRLELNLTDQVYDIFKSRETQFVSSEWENLCRRSIPFAPINGIEFGPAQRWWGSNTGKQPVEVDVVAESADGNYLLVGECKWSEITKPHALLKKTEQKGATLPFAKNKTIIPVLFVKNNPGNDPAPNIFTPDIILSRLSGR
jgi:AAA+ ATPase superfamily predicted ATPase